ncbi:UPF0280 family protein [Roseovarius indicus]|uniref:Thiamine biosynthesis protein ApbE n=1 Tax=Roseovarius indicus TaxID=540747 RepID=A0A0T5PEP6_9RHOB|nr:UPF0280 family protein [Roseovarius indicus]KRS19514.1 hypothetical protein XM52_01340 [Roseovarius indicus]QEW29159.1 hypothetical protein RIdsm_05001 [Roseovarius indicus]SFD78804.1 hypothetical protein SAMN04488031_102501 [Roseovarius indicus]
MPGPQISFLPDGRRLHLHHGPIDMIADVTGPGRETALQRAARRFETLLEELAAELPRLRSRQGRMPEGETARRMVQATFPFASTFITPMAAVAGAGAETILAAICDGEGVDKAYVNNGGDVAFYLAKGQRMQAAVASPTGGSIQIRRRDPIRGIATSGRGGRSHSLGIADSVTVLARSAALADAAATLLANAVDLPGHPSVIRSPASELAPDSDLGDRPVTTAVGPLTDSEITAALAAGAALADTFQARGLIQGALLSLSGVVRGLGPQLLSHMKDTAHA